MIGYAAVVTTVLIGTDDATRSLPATTPAALVAALKKQPANGFEGTLVSRLAPGLPDIPAAQVAGSSMNGELDGTHTLQVWYGGTDRQRIALLGAKDETDLIRNGRHLWRWNTASRVAVRSDVAAAPADRPLLTVPIPTASDLQSLTPAGLARTALGSIDDATDMSVSADHEIADRAAYDLTLTPSTEGTQVGSVHIAVDGETKVALGVQVFASVDADTPAVDVAFTRFRFHQPADRNFRFSPPSDARIDDLRGDDPAATEFQGGAGGPASRSASGPRARTLAPSGAGWVAVAAYRRGDTAAVHGGTRVSGRWGKGVLLESALLTVLVTDDGRVYSGAVGADALYTAAGGK